MLGDLVPPGLVLGPRRQRQRVAEAALRAARRSRALVPAMRRLEVAHLFRAAGQHVAEHRLGLGRAGLGGRPRPFEGGGEIRFARLLFGEQAFRSDRRSASPARPCTHSPPSSVCASTCPWPAARCEPARAFDPAGRHPGAFEIAAGDAVFRLGDPGLGRARQQREGLGGLALLAEPHRPAQCRLGRGEADQPVEDEHQSPSPAVTARACPPARAASCGRAGTSSTVRLPTLMSAVTGMPGITRNPPGTSCKATLSMAMRVR